MAISAAIKRKGDTKRLAYELMSIDTSKEFNKVPIAEVKLFDGNVAKQEFKALEAAALQPGAIIEIFIRHEGVNIPEEKIFEGVVVNHELERSNDKSILTIELCDVSIKMTTLRNNKVYKGKTDEQIIENLVEKHKLDVGEIAKTELAHTQMIQYYVSDWDFMLSRAEANGQLVVVDNSEISVVQPQIQNKPALKLEFGSKAFSHFDLKLNGYDQYQDVTSVGWDVKEQTLTKPVKGKDYKLGTIASSISQISSAIGTEQARLVHAVSLDPSELQSWSDAQIIKSRLSLVQGTIKIQGNGEIKVGQTLEIQKVGHFSGKHIISGVRQVFTQGEGWFTYVQIGMDSAWFTSRSDVVDTQAAGLLPGVNGLQIGTVKGYKEDLDHQFLVLVSIPAFGQGSESAEVYAKYTSLDAGADHGIFFLPEKGDEVVIGFLNDDPRQAVILGSMHSKPNKLPSTIKKKDKHKGIFTKSNYQLLFDEETKIVTLSTADENDEKKNKICINQKDECINLEDSHGNKIELNKDGITISSKKGCHIESDGDFTVTAKGNVKIEGAKVDFK